jgi:hypothetical protein
VFKQITVNGSETSQGQGSSETFENAVKLGPFTFGESLEVEYQNVTKVSTSAELTASIGLKSSQECVAADVEVFLDRAFGSFVTIPNFFDACAIDPMRTMSFEATSAWQVQNGTSTLSTDSVSGVRSLAVTANGWTSLVSGPLSSALLRGAARSADLSQVSFALRIPESQPNPSWIGASQMYITSPSANVYNAYMGQVELTPLPRGGFVRLGFSIPAEALRVLTEDHPDVSFTIILNVNPGAPAWLVDDLAIGAVDSGGGGGSGGTGGASGGALVGTLALSSNWDGGFCQVLSITNNGPTRVSSWSAVVGLGGAVVSQLWNGACGAGGCVGRTGTVTISSEAAWQGIEPGTTYSQTGWCTSPDNGVNGGSLVAVTGN